MTGWTNDQSELDPIAESVDVPLMRRSAAPKKDADMNALRQLANAQARSDISTSSRLQNRDTQIKAVVNYLCAIGAAICGFACFLFIPGLAKFIAVAMTAIVSVIYVMEGRRQFTAADYGDAVGAEADVDDAEEEYDEFEVYEEQEYEEDDDNFF
jgi:hypothetical protein